MKKIWSFINECCGSFLAWFDNKAVAFWFAFTLAVLGFFGADPVSDIPTINVCILAFLFGVGMVALLLLGTQIVKNSESYKWENAAYGAAGSVIGVIIALLLDKLIA